VGALLRKVRACVRSGNVCTSTCVRRRVGILTTTTTNFAPVLKSAVATARTPDVLLGALIFGESGAQLDITSPEAERTLGELAAGRVTADDVLRELTAEHGQPVHRGSALSNISQIEARLESLVVVCCSNLEMYEFMGREGIGGVYDTNYNFVALNTDATQLTADWLTHTALHELTHAILHKTLPANEALHGRTFRGVLMYLDYRQGLLTRTELAALAPAVHARYESARVRTTDEYAWEFDLKRTWLARPTGRFAFMETERPLRTHSLTARSRARRVLQIAVGCELDDFDILPATIELRLSSGVQALQSALSQRYAQLARAIRFDLAPQRALKMIAQVPLRGSVNVLDHIFLLYEALGCALPSRRHIGPRGLSVILDVVGGAFRVAMGRYGLALEGVRGDLRLVIEEDDAADSPPVSGGRVELPKLSPDVLVDALLRDEPFLVNTSRGTAVLYDGYLVNQARSRKDTLVVRDSLVDTTPRALDMLRDPSIVESEADVARGVGEFLAAQFPNLDTGAYVVARVRDDIFLFEDLLPLMRFDDGRLAYPTPIFTHAEWLEWAGSGGRSPLFVHRSKYDGAGDLSEHLYTGLRFEADPFFSRPGVVRELLKPIVASDVTLELSRRIRGGAPFLYLLMPHKGTIASWGVGERRPYIWVLSTGTSLHALAHSSDDLASGLRLDELLQRPALTLTGARANFREERGGLSALLQLPAATFGPEREVNLLRARSGSAWSVFGSLSAVSSLKGLRAASADREALIAVADERAEGFRFVLTSQSGAIEVSSTVAWWMVEL
jgi:hypothetical protein